MRQVERMLSEYVRFMQSHFPKCLPQYLRQSSEGVELWKIPIEHGECSVKAKRLAMIDVADVYFYQQLNNDGVYAGPLSIKFKDINGWDVEASVSPIEKEDDAWLVGMVRFVYRLGNFSIFEELQFS